MTPPATRADFASAAGRRPTGAVLLWPLALALVVLLPWGASAATIHFDDLESGFCLPNPLCTPTAGMVLSVDLLNLGVVFGQPGQSAGVAVIDGTRVNLAPSTFPNTIVGLDTAGNIPSNFTGTIYFGFFLPGSSTPAVSDFVSLTVGDGGFDADNFEIRAYGLDGLLVTSFLRPTDPSEVGRFPVEVLVDGIHRIEIQRLAGSGTQFGYSVDDVSFEINSAEPGLHALPEPATWLMLLSGLAGCLALKHYTRRG